MLITQCPACHTGFRITSEQLKQRHGMVRCGKCKQVFNGTEHLSYTPDPVEREESDTPLPAPSMAAPASAPEPSPHDQTRVHAPSTSESGVKLPWDTDLNPLTLIAEENGPKNPGEPAAASANIETRTPATEAIANETTDATADSADPLENAGNDTPELPPIELTPLEIAPPAFLRQRRHSRLATFLYSVLSLLGLLLLLAQGAYVFHDTLAAHWPESKPWLQRFCASAHCTVAALQQPDAITIETSDLQAAPGQKDVYTFNLLLRNRSALVQQLPALEILLTNIQNKPLVRRVFLPAEYLSDYLVANPVTPDPTKAEMLRNGLVANAEISLKLYWQTDRLDASGYRVYLFYP